MIELYPHQQEAVSKLKNGSILVGDVGSGKSATAIAYYILNHSDVPLYIITTAKKRDSKDWNKELRNQDIKDSEVIIDSWNSISKYKEVKDSFFIFDEQRVVGYGAWTKAFLKIAKSNYWILLSATPGDKYPDYMPVLIANGFYRNKTEFEREHYIYDRYCRNYPKVVGYLDESRLNRQIRSITVKMKDQRQTKRFNIKCTLDYDKELYKIVWKNRWNPYGNEPIDETGKLFVLLRRVVNSDKSRLDKLEELLRKHERVIIFYNFNFELEMMRERLTKLGVPYSEWNGQKHEEILKKDRWAYLVQYIAGAEGWNCVETDTIIFYSQTYSYRSREQAAGRIDRMNTKYTNLYYYHFVSMAPIDVAISRALKDKRNFNENTFLSQNSHPQKKHAL